MNNDGDLKAAIKDKYGKAASGVATPGCCGGSCGDPITSNLYGADERAALPEEAVSASLGCGNPTAMRSISILEKPSSTLDRAVASTCCCRLAASARRAKPTAWT